jgi:hypothetical protein
VAGERRKFPPLSGNLEKISKLKKHHGSNTKGCTLYPPDTMMSDFKRQTIIFLHNFVPSNDESISVSCFFTLGKTGKPNQALWLMPFRVLGKCIQRCNPVKFENIDSAVKFTIDKTILSNRMFFGDKCNWCDKYSGDVSS